MLKRRLPSDRCCKRLAAGRTAADSPLFTPRLQRRLLAVVGAALALHYAVTSRPVPATAIATFYPQDLPPAVRQSALGGVDTVLTRLQFDASSKLIVNATAESVLRVVADALPAEATEDALARLAFLIHKQFPAEQAEQIVALLRRYTHYRREELAWRERQPAPRTPDEELKQLVALGELQDRTLGAVLARQLYGEHRRLARYMLAARELERDTSLSADEKQARLRQLQRTIYVGHESEQH